MVMLQAAVARAQGTTDATLMLGVAGSFNLGEWPGVDVGLRLEQSSPAGCKWPCFGVESVTFINSQQKHDGGFKAGQHLLARVGSLLVGADYRYRDGGPWVKHTVWLVSGVSYRSAGAEIRVLTRIPIYDRAGNDPRALQFEVRQQPSGSRIGLVSQSGLLIYTDTEDAPNRYGMFTSAAVSIRLGRLR